MTIPPCDSITEAAEHTADVVPTSVSGREPLQRRSALGAGGASRVVPRRTAVDLARLVAAYAIVWIHTPRSSVLASSTALGRFAVPFFAFATVFFVFQTVARDPRRPFAHYASGRLVRLYLPFLAWSMIYLGFKGLKSFAFPNQPNEYPGIEFLWVGGFYHLWFMPFILCVSLMAFVLAKTASASRTSSRILCLASGALGLAGMALPFPSWLASAHINVLLVLDASPAVLLGIALASQYRELWRWIETLPAAILGAVMLVSCTAWTWYAGHSRPAETLAGLGLLLLALGPFFCRSLAPLSRLGTLAFGIYLGHMLFIKTLEAVATAAKLPICWQLDLAVFTFACLGSTLLAWLLSRHRYTRWLAA